MNISDILPKLEKTMGSLEGKLQAMSTIRELGVTIDSGAWINKNGVGIGYLSCSRVPNEDSIELTIDLVYKDNSLKSSIGIYWSGGRMIKEISNIELTETNTDGLLSKLESYFEDAGQKALEYLVHFILNQKDKPNDAISSSG